MLTLIDSVINLWARYLRRCRWSGRFSPGSLRKCCTCSRQPASWRRRPVYPSSKTFPTWLFASVRQTFWGRQSWTLPENRPATRFEKANLLKKLKRLLTSAWVMLLGSLNHSLGGVISLSMQTDFRLISSKANGATAKIRRLYSLVIRGLNWFLTSLCIVSKRLTLFNGCRTRSGLYLPGL